jgi:predicted Co/Zn/Cd cation transporter (cation efflux family)
LQIDEIEKGQRCYKQAIDESDFPLGSAHLEALLLMLNEATNMKLATAACVRGLKELANESA